MWRDDRELFRWCEEQETWTRIIKTQDQTKNSDTTYATDTDLQFRVDANRIYTIRLKIWFDTDATPDFKFQFTGPGSPTLLIAKGHYWIPGASADSDFFHTAFSTSVAVTGASSADGFIEADVLLQNGANMGVFALQWAQNTSDAGDTIVRGGSYIEYFVL